MYSIIKQTNEGILNHLTYIGVLIMFDRAAEDYAKSVKQAADNALWQSESQVAQYAEDAYTVIRNFIYHAQAVSKSINAAAKLANVNERNSELQNVTKEYEKLETTHQYFLNDLFPTLRQHPDELAKTAQNDDLTEELFKAVSNIFDGVSQSFKLLLKQNVVAANHQTQQIAHTHKKNVEAKHQIQQIAHAPHSLFNQRSQPAVNEVKAEKRNNRSKCIIL